MRYMYNKADERGLKIREQRRGKWFREKHGREGEKGDFIPADKVICKGKPC